jgi:hypothetical protein
MLRRSSAAVATSREGHRSPRSEPVNPRWFIPLVSRLSNAEYFFWASGHDIRHETLRNPSNVEGMAEAQPAKTQDASVQHQADIKHPPIRRALVRKMQMGSRPNDRSNWLMTGLHSKCPTPFLPAKNAFILSPTWRPPPHACGAVRNICCDVSALTRPGSNPSAAPPPPNPAVACTS